MAIEKGRLAFKSGSHTRQQAKKVAVVISSALPGTYDLKVVNGSLVQYIEAPAWEGRMIVHYPAGDTRGYLYVAVDIDGVLTWVETDSGITYIHAQTGEEWTGMEGFLSPWVAYPSS